MADHKQEALDWLTVVTAVGADKPPYTAAEETQAIAVAQLHATLELAEQQRLANLIAWQQMTGESNPDLIREGLGL
ncbi:MAG: hypothetical protein JWP32_2880 [Schumannella sp.]|nr:hypothetical protein [Schumannella sp.]